MKISMDKEEMMILIKRSFPKEMIPEGYTVTGVETKGYPEKEFAITLEREEKPIETNQS